MYRKRVESADIMFMWMKNREILVFERAVFFVIMIFEKKKGIWDVYKRQKPILSLEAFLHNAKAKIFTTRITRGINL